MSDFRWGDHVQWHDDPQCKGIYLGAAGYSVPQTAGYVQWDGDTAGKLTNVPLENLSPLDRSRDYTLEFEWAESPWGGKKWWVRARVYETNPWGTEEIATASLEHSEYAEEWAESEYYALRRPGNE